MDYGKRSRLVLSALAMALALTLPIAGQEKGLTQLLSGKTHPLSMKLKDLNGEWRRVMIHGGDGVSGNIDVNVSGSTQGSTSQNNLTGLSGGAQAYVTRGQTVSVHGQNYLVAYRLPGTGLDWRALLLAMATKTLPKAEILTPESSVRLSLLNLQAVTSLEDVSVFDMKAEIAQSQEAAQKLADLLKAMATQPAKPPEGEKSPKPEKK
jgi:hypothetical protein